MDATPYLYRVTLGDVHDGDTVWVTIDLGFYLAHRVPVRLAGINAPELAAPAGQQARDALIAFVAAHPGQWLAQTYKSGEDKYRRWLARLIAPDGTDLNNWMVASGHAVPMA